MGFGPDLLSQLTLDELETLPVGRVVFEAHGHLRLATADGVRAALIAGPLRDRVDRVIVGDWVVTTPGDPLIATRRLDRRNALRRRDPGDGVQWVAANLDIAWVCQAATDPNARRLERWAALCADADVPATVVITKRDLADPCEVAAVAARLGLPSIAVHALGGDGLSELFATVRPGETAALLGLSGAGKSTLLNALVGSAAAETGEVRASDGRGRHTTTARHLYRLPNSGWLLDNPGVRTLGLVDEASLESVFPEIDALVGRCRFRDCAHDQEPGCALRDAVDRGEVREERFAAWRKLQRELAYDARRDDPAARRAERERWKRIHLVQRARDRTRDR
jgi:ribosome biogenesis GTPase